jgi:two-component system, OmpR family, KDP operon response regulator KdpE
MNGKNILLVDDDQDLLLGLTARLKASGYTVICATNAISAITVARKEVPDLVILDLGLPGDEGLLVLERMRGLADLAAIPVIVLSARDPVRNKTRVLDAGAKAYFQKPADNRRFLAAIRQTLGETIALSSTLEPEFSQD